MIKLILSLLILTACSKEKQINIELCNNTMSVHNDFTGNSYTARIDSSDIPEQLLNELEETRLKRMSKSAFEIYDTLQITYCQNETSVDFVRALKMLNGYGYLKIKFGEISKIKNIEFTDYCNGCDHDSSYNHVSKIKSDSVFYCIEKCSYKRKEKNVICSDDELFYDSCFVKSFDHYKNGKSLSKKVVKISDARKMQVMLYMNYLDGSQWNYCENKFGGSSYKNIYCGNDDHRIIIDKNSKMNGIERSLVDEITKYDSISSINGVGVGTWEIDVD